MSDLKSSGCKTCTESFMFDESFEDKWYYSDMSREEFSILDQITAPFKSIGEKLKSTFDPKKITAVFDKAINSIKSTTNKIAKTMNKAANTVTNAGKRVASSVAKTGKTVATGVANTGKKVANTVASAGKKVGNAAKSVVLNVKKLGDKIWNFIKTNGKKAIEIIKVVANWFYNTGKFLITNRALIILFGFFLVMLIIYSSLRL
jgi:hypothetical protein